MPDRCRYVRSDKSITKNKISPFLGENIIYIYTAIRGKGLLGIQTPPRMAASGYFETKAITKFKIVTNRQRMVTITFSEI